MNILPWDNRKPSPFRSCTLLRRLRGLCLPKPLPCSSRLAWPEGAPWGLGGHARCRPPRPGVRGAQPASPVHALLPWTGASSPASPAHPRGHQAHRQTQRHGSSPSSSPEAAPPDFPFVPVDSNLSTTSRDLESQLWLFFDLPTLPFDLLLFQLFQQLPDFLSL